MVMVMGHGSSHSHCNAFAFLTLTPAAHPMTQEEAPGPREPPQFVLDFQAHCRNNLQGFEARMGTFNVCVLVWASVCAELWYIARCVSAACVREGFLCMCAVCV